MLKTALVLTGGGARAAYQVGVVRAISDLIPREAPCPFPILCGTSAGAINAAALAMKARNFRQGVGQLMRVWKNFHAHHVYRSDPVGAIGNSLHWLASLGLRPFGRSAAVSLLDTEPLVRLLRNHIDFKGIGSSVEAGALDALAITASGYTSGQSVTFFQGVGGIEPWKRARRVGMAANIEIEHLLASTAIPFFFPAVKINREYFGDGSMRQIAPVSPALHLGADRMLVVAVGRRAWEAPERVNSNGYPSLAQIAGHTLNSIFLDSMEVDLERLQRINRTVSQIPGHILESGGINLRRVEVLVITPSEAIESIAERHVHTLPRTIRFLFGTLGATRRTGANLVSYLLFEKAFCRELIQLGYKDAMEHKEEILRFVR